MSTPPKSQKFSPVLIRTKVRNRGNSDFPEIVRKGKAWGSVSSNNATNLQQAHPDHGRTL